MARTRANDLEACTRPVSGRFALGHREQLPELDLRGPLGLACLAEPVLPAGERVRWGGWGSNPRPADYEKYGPVHRTH